MEIKVRTLSKTEKSVNNFFYSDGRIGNEADLFSDEIKSLLIVDSETVVKVEVVQFGSGPDTRKDHHFACSWPAAQAAGLKGGLKMNDEYIDVK